MPLAISLIAPVLSSLILALAFPPYSIRILAFVALVPFLVALRSGSLRRGVALGWIFGVAIGWSIAWVFPSSIAEYYDRPAWFGVLAGMVVFTVTSSFYYMAFGALEWCLSRRLLPVAPFLTAAAWVTVELGRERLFTGTDFFIGNPWGLLGYTHASGALAQTASWTGVYGVSFAIVVVNASLADWFMSWRDPSRSTRAAGWGVLVATLPALVLSTLGAQALRQAPDASETDGLIEVAVIQGDVAVGRRWKSEYYGKNLDIYIELTMAALRAGSPSVIVWPEGAMNFFLETEPIYREAIARVLRAGDAELLAGGPGQNGETRPPVFNSVFRVSPEGRIVDRYDKEILMPFSEYYPFGAGSLMRRHFEGARFFTKGATDPAPIDSRMGRVGLLLCNEAMLSSVAAARVRAGAEILVNPSNDGWIDGEAFAEHMLAIVGMRAIEQRRYLVRASTSGPSAVIDPWGRIAVRTPPQTRHLLRGGVRPKTELTVYSRIGDAFALTCMGIVAAVLSYLTWASRSRV